MSMLKFSSKDGRVEDSFNHWIRQTTDWLETNRGLVLNADQVHDLRVMVRQLKSLTYFFKPVLKNEDYKLGQALLGEILHLFGAARENTVFMAAILDFEKWLSQKGYKNNDDLKIRMFSDALIPWIQYHSDQYDFEIQRLESNQIKLTWVTLTEKWLDHIRQITLKEKITSKSADQFAKKRLGRMMKQWLIRYGEPELQEDTWVHRSRIEVKRIRYALRASEGSLIPAAPDLLSALEIYQDASGGLHDIAVFQVMTEEEDEHFFQWIRPAFLEFLKERRTFSIEVLNEAHTSLTLELARWIQDIKGE
jgi:CHAD domain-containing protein